MESESMRIFLFLLFMGVILFNNRYSSLKANIDVLNKKLDLLLKKGQVDLTELETQIIKEKKDNKHFALTLLIGALFCIILIFLIAVMVGKP